jgi:hypothetical protein
MTNESSGGSDGIKNVIGRDNLEEVLRALQGISGVEVDLQNLDESKVELQELEIEGYQPTAVAFSVRREDGVDSTLFFLFRNGEEIMKVAPTIASLIGSLAEDNFPASDENYFVGFSDGVIDSKEKFLELLALAGKPVSPTQEPTSQPQQPSPVAVRNPTFDVTKAKDITDQAQGTTRFKSFVKLAATSIGSALIGAAGYAAYEKYRSK